MIVPPDTDNGLGIILLNSNADSQFSFTNALGMMSVEQVRGMEIASKSLSAGLLGHRLAPSSGRISSAQGNRLRTASARP